MEKILDYYLRKNEDPEWVTKYSSLAKENDGKIFEYVNTNFRKLHSFENAFIEFSKNDGKKRGDWENSDDLDRSAGSPEKELMKDAQKIGGNGGGFGSDGGMTPPVPPVAG